MWVFHSCLAPRSQTQRMAEGPDPDPHATAGPFPEHTWVAQVMPSATVLRSICMSSQAIFRGAMSEISEAATGRRRHESACSNGVRARQQDRRREQACRAFHAVDLARPQLNVAEMKERSHQPEDLELVIFGETQHLRGVGAPAVAAASELWRQVQAPTDSNKRGPPWRTCMAPRMPPHSSTSSTLGRTVQLPPVR